MKRARVVYTMRANGMVQTREYGDLFVQRDGPAPRSLLEGAISFRVRPGKGPTLGPVDKRFYWTVHVFPTKRALWDYAEWRSVELESTPTYAGKVIPRSRFKVEQGKCRHASKLGECVLWKGCIGSGVIAHECLHMATSTLRALRLETGERGPLLSGDGIDDSEERLAYMLTAIVRPVVDTLWQAGLYYGDGGLETKGAAHAIRC